MKPQYKVVKWENLLTERERQLNDMYVAGYRLHSVVVENTVYGSFVFELMPTIAGLSAAANTVPPQPPANQKFRK